MGYIDNMNADVRHSSEGDLMDKIEELEARVSILWNQRNKALQWAVHSQQCSFQRAETGKCACGLENFKKSIK